MIEIAAKAAQKIAENSTPIQVSAVGTMALGHWTMNEIAMGVSIIVGIGTFVTTVIFKLRQDRRDQRRFDRGD